MSGSGFKGPRSQQGWINFAVMAASALLGRKDKKDASRQADTDRGRELAIQEGSLELARNQDARAGRLFEHYEDTFLPRERELVSEAFGRTISPARAEARAVGDVRSSLAMARDMGQRNQRRLGVDPSSGSSLALARSTDLEEARIEAGARTSAREGTRDRNFNRQATVLGLGSPTAASPYASGAQAGFDSASVLAGARTAYSDALAHRTSVGAGASLGALSDAAADLWRGRRRRDDDDGGILDSSGYRIPGT